MLNSTERPPIQPSPRAARPEATRGNRPTAFRSLASALTALAIAAAAAPLSAFPAAARPAIAGDRLAQNVPSNPRDGRPGGSRAVPESVGDGLPYENFAPRNPRDPRHGGSRAVPTPPRPPRPATTRAATIDGSLSVLVPKFVLEELDETALGDTNDLRPVAFGATASDRPTFYVYLSDDSAVELNLALYTEDGSNPSHFVTVPVGGVSGLVAVPLGPDVPPLEVGQTYRWTVQLVFDPNDLGSSELSEGVVVRESLSPETEAALAAAESAEAQARVYAEAGLWFDFVNILVRARETPSGQALWQETLETFEFEEATDAPLVSP